jgi:hypothetical protein
MIYEFRTYTLRPGTLSHFLQLFAEALPKRERFSQLAAFWHTEIGPLNEVIHVWPYENAHERTRIRAEAVKDGSWPPKTGELIVDMRAEIFDRLPFSPDLPPRESGSVFEIRVDTLKPFTIPAMAEQWRRRLEAASEVNALIGLFASDVGVVNQWMHIWAYKSLDERVAIREKMGGQPLCSAQGDSLVIRQETKLVRPAPFSRIK